MMTPPQPTWSVELRNGNFHISWESRHRAGRAGMRRVISTKVLALALCPEIIIDNTLSEMQAAFEGCRQVPR